MFDESYDNYIRSILGYTTTTPNGYGYQNNPNYEYTPMYRQNTNNRELEECYPEIYKIINPMVTKTCNSIQDPVTKEMIEQLTDKIYFAIEENNEVNININLTNEVKNNTSSKIENRGIKQPEKEKTNETRVAKSVNRNLRDLIKILLLKELLNRPDNRPPFPRPGFPPGSHFPGESGVPGSHLRPPMRPPIMPRGIELNYDIYEA